MKDLILLACVGATAYLYLQNKALQKQLSEKTHDTTQPILLTQPKPERAKQSNSLELRPMQSMSNFNGVQHQWLHQESHNG